jgi:hypothetical protein
MPWCFGQLTAMHCCNEPLFLPGGHRMTRMGCADWKQLAEAARDEEDPKKLMHLIEQLNRVLDEHIKDLHPHTSTTASTAN